MVYNSPSPTHGEGSKNLHKVYFLKHFPLILQRSIPPLYKKKKKKKKKKKYNYNKIIYSKKTNRPTDSLS